MPEADKTITISVSAKPGQSTISSIVTKQIKEIKEKLKEIKAVKANIDFKVAKGTVEAIETLHTNYSGLVGAAESANAVIAETAASLKALQANAGAAAKQLAALQKAYTGIASESANTIGGVATQFQSIVDSIKMASAELEMFVSKIATLSEKKIVIDIKGKGSSELPITDKLTEIVARFNETWNKLRAAAKDNPIVLSVKTPGIDKRLQAAMSEEARSGVEKILPGDMAAIERGLKTITELMDKVKSRTSLTAEEWKKFTLYIDKAKQSVIGLKDVDLRFDLSKMDVSKITEIEAVAQLGKAFDEVSPHIKDMEAHLETLNIKIKELSKSQEAGAKDMAAALTEEANQYRMVIDIMKKAELVAGSFFQQLKQPGKLKWFGDVVREYEPFQQIMDRVGVHVAKLRENADKTSLRWHNLAKSTQDFAKTTDKSMKEAAAASEKYAVSLEELVKWSQYLQELEARQATGKKRIPGGLSPEALKEMEAVLQEYGFTIDAVRQKVTQLGNETAKIQQAMTAGMVNVQALQKTNQTFDAMDKKVIDLRSSFVSTDQVIRGMIGQMNMLKGVDKQFLDAAQGFKALNEQGKAFQLQKQISQVEKFVQAMDKLGIATEKDFTDAANAIKLAEQGLEKLNITMLRDTQAAKALGIELSQKMQKGLMKVIPYFDKTSQGYKHLVAGLSKSNQAALKFNLTNNKTVSSLEVLDRMLKDIKQSQRSFGQSLGEASRSASLLHKSIGLLDQKFNEMLQHQIITSEKIAWTRSEMERLGKSSGDTSAKINALKVSEKGHIQTLNILNMEMEKVNRQQAEYRKQLEQSQLMMARSADATKAMARWTVSGFTQMVKSQAAWLIGFALFFGAFDKLKSAIESIVDIYDQLARALRTVRSEMMSTAEVAVVMRSKMIQAATGLGSTFEQTGELFYQLGSAGLQAEESLAAFDSTLKAILATEEEVGDYTKLVTGIYKNFRDELSATGDQTAQFQSINDTLVATFRDHLVEMSELRDGMKYSIATAKEVGLSYDDLSGILGVLNDHMIKAGIAGRSLQVIFARMSKDADKFAAAFDIEIDLTKPLDFLDILDQVAIRMEAGALTAGDVGVVFERLGLRGAKSFITLVKYADEVRESINTLRTDAIAATDEMFDEMADKPEFVFKRLAAAIDAVMRINMAPFVETFLSLANVVSKVVEGVINLDQKFGGALSSIAKIAAVWAAWKIVLVATTKSMALFTNHVLGYTALNYAQYIGLEAKGLKTLGMSYVRNAKRLKIFGGATKEQIRLENELARAMNEAERAAAKKGDLFGRGLTAGSKAFQASLDKLDGKLKAVTTSQAILRKEQFRFSNAVSQSAALGKTLSAEMLQNAGITDKLKGAYNGLAAAQQEMQTAFINASQNAQTFGEKMQLAGKAIKIFRAGGMSFVGMLSILGSTLGIVAQRLVSFYIYAQLAIMALKWFIKVVKLTNEEIKENIQLLDQQIGENNQQVDSIKKAVKAIDDYKNSLIDVNQYTREVSQAFVLLGKHVPDIRIVDADKYRSQLEAIRKDLEQNTKHLERMKLEQQKILRARAFKEMIKGVEAFDKAVGKTERTFFNFIKRMLKGMTAWGIFADTIKSVWDKIFPSLKSVSESLGEQVGEIQNIRSEYQAATKDMEEFAKAEDMERYSAAVERQAGLAVKLKLAQRELGESYGDVIKELDDANVKTTDYTEGMRKMFSATEDAIDASPLMQRSFIDISKAAQGMAELLTEGADSTEEFTKALLLMSELRPEDKIESVKNVLLALSKRLKEDKVTGEAYARAMAEGFNLFGIEVPKSMKGVEAGVDALKLKMDTLKDATVEDLTNMVGAYGYSFSLMNRIVEKNMKSISKTMADTKLDFAGFENLNEQIESIKSLADIIVDQLQRHFEAKMLEVDLDVALNTHKAIMDMNTLGRTAEAVYEVWAVQMDVVDDKSRHLIKTTTDYEEAWAEMIRTTEKVEGVIAAIVKLEEDRNDNLEDTSVIYQDIQAQMARIAGIEAAAEFDKIGVGMDKARKFIDTLRGSVNRTTHSIDELGQQQKLFGDISKQAIGAALDAYSDLNGLILGNQEALLEYIDAQREAEKAVIDFNRAAADLDIFEKAGVGLDDYVKAEKKRTDTLEKQKDLTIKIAAERKKLVDIDPWDTEAVLNQTYAIEKLETKYNKMDDDLKEIRANSELYAEAVGLATEALARTENQLADNKKLIEEEIGITEEWRLKTAAISEELQKANKEQKSIVGVGTQAVHQMDRQRESVEKTIELYEDQKKLLEDQMERANKLAKAQDSDDDDRVAALVKIKDEYQDINRTIEMLNKGSLDVAKAQVKIQKAIVDELGNRNTLNAEEQFILAKAKNELLTSEEALNKMVAQLREMTSVLKDLAYVMALFVKSTDASPSIQASVDKIIELRQASEDVNKTAEIFKANMESGAESVSTAATQMDSMNVSVESANVNLEKNKEIMSSIKDEAAGVKEQVEAVKDANKLTLDEIVAQYGGYADLGDKIAYYNTELERTVEISKKELGQNLAIAAKQVEAAAEKQRLEEHNLAVAEKAVAEYEKQLELQEQMATKESPVTKEIADTIKDKLVSASKDGALYYDAAANYLEKKSKEAADYTKESLEKVLAEFASTDIFQGAISFMEFIERDPVGEAFADASESVRDNLNKTWNYLEDKGRDTADYMAERIERAFREGAEDIATTIMGSRGYQGGEVGSFQHGGMVPVRVSDGEAFIPAQLFKQNKQMFKLMNRGVSMFSGTPGIDRIQTVLPEGSFVMSRKGVRANKEFFETSASQRFYSGGMVAPESQRPAATAKDPEDMGSINLTLTVGDRQYQGQFVTRSEVAKSFRDDLKREKMLKIQD